jgi:hypothetical protein
MRLFLAPWTVRFRKLMYPGRGHPPRLVTLDDMLPFLLGILKILGLHCVSKNDGWRLQQNHKGSIYRYNHHYENRPAETRSRNAF